MSTPTRIFLALLCAAALFTIILQFRPRPTPSPPPIPVITAAEFDRIQIGMTYPECVAIIGAPGAPYGATNPPETPLAETEWVSYTWHNTRTSSAEITFNYGQVESKRSYKLP